jgi:fermentation-respiration switch protein FrsA (DUF1100 family)
LKIFIFLLVVGLLLWLGLRWLEQNSLYYPDRQIIATPSQVGMPYEEARFKTSDGVDIHGWWIPRGGQPAAPTILLCHGNAGNMSHRLDKIARLRKAGANVFLFDYRGYGQSDPRVPTEAGTYRDAEAAYRYLTETRRIPASRIVLHGESLGGAIAVELARKHPAAGLILESAFTSTADMAARVFPWLPARWVVRYRYDNLSKLPQIEIPTLFLHSPQDDIVPFDMAQKNLAATTAPKRLVQLIGDHNEGYVDSGDTYIQALADFIAGFQKGNQ